MQCTSFILGGKTGSSKLDSVLKYETSNIFNGSIEVESLVQKRRYIHCTIFYSQVHNGRPVVIAVGKDLSSVNSAEIWDFTAKRSYWEESKPIFLTRSYLIYQK